jgi:hypothetical protein
MPSFPDPEEFDPESPTLPSPVVGILFPYSSNNQSPSTVQ